MNTMLQLMYAVHPELGKDPWRREWLPTLVLLPGELQGQVFWDRIPGARTESLSLQATVHGVTKSHI